jgi:transposase
VPNDAAGWANLVEQLRGCSIAAIGIEASGGYERGVMRALLAAGVAHRVAFEVIICEVPP